MIGELASAWKMFAGIIVVVATLVGVGYGYIRPLEEQLARTQDRQERIEERLDDIHQTLVRIETKLDIHLEQDEVR